MSRRNFKPRFVFSLLSLLLLIVQPIAATAGTGMTDASDRTAIPASDQKAIQVLSRLTFGTRPGDLEQIKKIGVNAYIEQQLSPGTIDDAALDKRLEKLGTLSLSSPAIAEQYNPPKPTPSPTPTPAAAKTVDSTAASGNMMTEAVEIPA